jgi:putative ABC transport system permease protein
VLGLAAGAVGLGLAVYLVKGARAAGVGILPRVEELRVDGTSLLFTLGLSLLTSIIFGLAPAFHAVRADLAAAMRSLGKSSGGRRGLRARDALIVGQVAVSLMLLIGAGLLMRTLWELQRVKLGFETERVFTALPNLAAQRYPDRAAVQRFWTQFLGEVRAIPGVERAAATGLFPMRGGGDTYFYVDGRPPTTAADRSNATVSVITDDYFSVMETPIIAGRSFGPTEVMDGVGAVIINRALADRLFPRGSALGERLVVDFGRPFTAEIVGIAGDVMMYGPAVPPIEIMYFSLRQSGGFGALGMRLAIRTRGDPLTMTAPVRAALQRVDPSASLTNAESLDQIMYQAVAQPRFRARLFAGFAATALILAVVGLYGVLGYSVSQRAREMAIRLALGAPRGDVFALVVRHGMALVVSGIIIGIALSFAATKLLSRLLFGVEQTDPLVFAGVTAMLVAAGLAASIGPARRATHADPVVTLRGD